MLHGDYKSYVKRGAQGIMPLATHAHEATEISRKQAPPCLSDAAQHARFGELAGLQPHKTAPFVGYEGFSRRRKTLIPHSNQVGGKAASEQAVAYLRENTEAKRFFALQSGGLGGANPRKHSFCCHFLRRSRNNDNKRGAGAVPQWEICVSLMLMG